MRTKAKKLISTIIVVVILSSLAVPISALLKDQLQPHYGNSGLSNSPQEIGIQCNDVWDCEEEYVMEDYLEEIPNDDILYVDETTVIDGNKSRVQNSDQEHTEIQNSTLDSFEDLTFTPHDIPQIKTTPEHSNNKTPPSSEEPPQSPVLDQLTPPETTPIPSPVPEHPPLDSSIPTQSPAPEPDPTPPDYTTPEPTPIPPPAPINIPVTSISMSVNRTFFNYKIGETGSVAVNMFPSNATDRNYSLSVNNASVLNISQNGQFTAISAGTVIITATAQNGVKREITVNVYDINGLASEVISLTNAERRNNDISTLSSENSVLNTAAMTRAKEIVINFSHIRPDGRGQSTAFEDLGGQYTGYYTGTGENIAAGHLSPSAVVSGWMSSSGHRANILDPNYTHIGIGVDIDSNGRFHWVQMFYG
jgi:uncharacterized protein YkwD